MLRGRSFISHTTSLCHCISNLNNHSLIGENLVSQTIYRISSLKHHNYSTNSMIPSSSIRNSVNYIKRYHIRCDKSHYTSIPTPSNFTKHSQNNLSRRHNHSETWLKNNSLSPLWLNKLFQAKGFGKFDRSKTENGSTASTSKSDSSKNNDTKAKFPNGKKPNNETEPDIPPQFFYLIMAMSFVAGVAFLVSSSDQVNGQ